MKIEKIWAMYFSPTGNSKKISKGLGEALSESLNAPLEYIDITSPAARRKPCIFKRNELLIITFPVYAGRLPNKIAPYITDMIQGDMTKLIATVSYGNRNYDDALSEMVYECGQKGFITIGGAAVPSQHAFSHKLAFRRPNDDDMNQLVAYAKKLADEIENADDSDEIKAKEIPGNMPPGPYYKPLQVNGEPAIFLKAKPKTYYTLCDGCGECYRVCPMNAISIDDFRVVTGTCIKCQACIKNCHNCAKYFDDPQFLSHVEMLENTYAGEVKEIEFI